jgi:hypothetical protein
MRSNLPQILLTNDPKDENENNQISICRNRENTQKENKDNKIQQKKRKHKK